MAQVVNCTIIALLLLSISVNAYSQVSFCAVGDILLDRGVRTMIEKNNVYYPFSNIAQYVKEKDLALCNIECPIVNTSEGAPINKKYSFRADTEYIQGLLYAGFNIASVANNHTMDYGKSGFVKTIEYLEKDSIWTVGGGMNQRESFKPLLIEKNGETFAVFAMLEFLLEGTVYNEDKPYPALGNIERLCQEIIKIQGDIDNIIVSFHWGKEGSFLPTSQQIDYAHRVIDAGADLVLGHHPHVLQSVETYKQKLIVYSLGNFIFDNIGLHQNQSVIFTCTFHNGYIIDPAFIPIQIQNYQPSFANKNQGIRIFNHLSKLSNPFHTMLQMTDSSIKVLNTYEQPLKELYKHNGTFCVYKDRLQANIADNQRNTFSIADSLYHFIDADLFIQDNIVYIYSIVKSQIDSSAYIAVFPYSLRHNEFLRPSIDSHKRLNPWKIKVLDIDNDGNEEIIVGVNTSTRYYSSTENRISVYNVDKDYFFPKWLGSKVGGSFIDFTVCRETNRLLLLQTSEVSKTIKEVAYTWNGFGFDFDEILHESVGITDKKLRFLQSRYTFKKVF
jgi:poly-gamma-glutamate synthesis protein (capsule biosynthesis protein)